MKEIMVTQSSMPPYDEFCKEIRDIWETVHLTNNGPKHQKLEEKLCQFLNVNHVSLFSNGHLALYLALKSLNLKGEVITTPFTFASTTNAIIENGLKPVFCDIDPVTYTIDVNKIEELITEKTCAIVPVHVYGNICDVEKIEKISKKYNLKVIYDAAHVFGVEYKNRSICEYGDISMLSFHATKVFNTIEGGCLIYKDKTFYSLLSALKNFGIDSEANIVCESINAKMNEFQAAMGLCNLKYISSEIEKRERVANTYNDFLSSISGIRVNINQENVKTNYAYYPILVDSNEFGVSAKELHSLLKKNGVYTRRYFHPLITDFEYYQSLGYNSIDTPIAKEIAENILCLPMYANLSLDDVTRICSIIKESHI